MSKIFRISCFVFFNLFTLPLQAAELQPGFNEKKLYAIAEKDGYGYKYGNLFFLQTLTDQFNKNIKNKYRVAVPNFVGIPSENIQKFLKKQAKLDIVFKWNTILSQFFKTSQEKEAALNGKKFPAGFLGKVLTLENEIKAAFTKISSEVKPDFPFDKSFGLTGIDKLISNIKNKGIQERFMVRSSGKEDTRKLANAGGNESVANVQPQAKDLLLTMGTVVASYFSQKSLTQRLGAQDSSLFDQTPFTPVLIQWMIGEKEGVLPKCGVMFTEEPEGGIAKFEQKNAYGKILTTKNTLIQAAYGHNEGVVNSLIPVDTYYVDEQNNIYSVIRPKTHRMAPRKNMPGVELQENKSFSVINFPSLDQEALLTLKSFANALEHFYGYPMDVEFVINEEEKTIYIVQARPIVHNPNQQQAAYLSNTKDIPAQDKVSGSAIGVAGGALHWITNPNQIILAADIGNALRAYQSAADRTKVEALIVGKMAPSTSHEATTFRGELKPVIFIPNWQTIQEWLKDLSVKLVVSPQQGTVVNWKGAEKSLQDLFANKKALMGWNSYPVPRLVSVTFGTLFATDFLTKESLQKLFAGKIAQNALSDQEIETADFATLLESIKNDSAEKSIASLALLMFKTEKQLNQKAFVGKELTKDKNLVGMFALEYAKRILPTLLYQKNSMGYPRRLFAIRFLESLIFQQPAPEEIVGGLSLINLVKDISDIQKVSKEFSAIQKIHPMAGILFVRVKKLALTDELAKNWEIFIAKLAQQDKQIQSKVIKLLMDLAQFNLLPVWINTSFYNTFDATTPVLEAVEKLLKEFLQDQDFLKELTTMQKKLESFNTAPFADPKTFMTQWNIFNKEILAYFLDDAFIKKYKEANGLAKLAAGSVMHKLVDTFDASIKAVTGSTNPEFSKTKKVEFFQLMLKQYAALFKKWAINILTEQNKCFSEWSKLDDFIEHIDRVVNKTGMAISIKDLEATHGFDVQVFTIGSGANPSHFGIQPPLTFEDVFTMIHQCLLRMLGIFCLDAGGENFAEPVLLKKVEKVIKDQLIDEENVVKLNGTLISSAFLTSGIKLTYNVPLRGHSVLIELYYDKKNKNIIIAPAFFGANMRDRWNQIGILVNFLDYLGIFKVVNFKFSASMISFGLVFDQNSKAEDLTKYLNNMIYITYIYTWKDFDLFTHPNFPKAYKKIFQLILDSELFSENFLVDLITGLFRIDTSTVNKETLNMLYSIIEGSANRIKDQEQLKGVIATILKLDLEKINRDYFYYLFSWFQKNVIPNIKNYDNSSEIIIGIIQLDPTKINKPLLKILANWTGKTLPKLNNPELEQQFKEWKAKIPSTEVEKK